MVALEIGPTDADIEAEGSLEALREIWVEHRAEFGPSSWAAMFWERGHDIRLDDPYDPDAPIGCPGLGE
jgi:hypothetical protein